MHKSDKIHAHTIMMHSVQALYCNWDCHWDCLRILGKTVEVTNRAQYPYSGVIVIPSSINSERVRLWCNKYWILCFLVLQWLEITDISPERLLMEDGKTIFNVSFKRDRSFRVTGEIIMDPAKAIPVKQFADSCDKREWPPCYWWESQGQAYRPKVWTKVLFMGHTIFRVIDCRKL